MHGQKNIKLIKYSLNTTVLIFLLRIYSDTFRLLEVIFRLNINDCVRIYYFLIFA